MEKDNKHKEETVRLDSGENVRKQDLMEMDIMDLVSLYNYTFHNPPTRDEMVNLIFQTYKK